MKTDAASATASVVALGCLCDLKDTGAPFDTRVIPLLEAFLSAPGISAPHRLAAALSGSRWVRRSLRGAMDLIIPGMFAHYIARKAFIEERVRGMLREGRTQLVVIAGGFDTLAIRLAQDIPALRVIEIDHPATQAVKRDSLRLSGAVTANLCFVAADLAAEPLGVALARGGFDPEMGAVFVLEGFLMYLPEADVRRIFLSFAQATEGRLSDTPSPACIFTVMSIREDGVVGFSGGHTRFVNAWLARQQERFLWGLEPGGVPVFVEGTGWTWSDSSTPAALKAFQAGGGGRLAEGESIHVARLSLARTSS